MTRRKLGLIKALTAAACLAPLLWLALRASGATPMSLGANPVQEVLHTLGKTGLNLLIITLAVSPARALTGIVWLGALRRMLGLFAFFYALAHMLAYAGLDQRFAWSSLLIDVTQRPYITVGFLALLGMVPLAVTSTNAMQRRLGRKWKTLHRLIYPIGVLGIVHFLWQTKATVPEPFVYALVLGLLLAWRAAPALRRQSMLLRRRSAQ